MPIKKLVIVNISGFQNELGKLLKLIKNRKISVQGINFKS
jgi:hypothetical protein